MQLFDKKFHDNKRTYILQCALATGVVMIVLFLLDTLSATAIIASLGATSFIAFTMPHANSSKPRYLLGGYAVGIFVGTSMKLISLSSFFQNIPLFYEYPDVFFGALAVGLAIFIMVITNFEHPPACGLALGLVQNEFNWWTLVVVIVGVITITLIKTLMKPYMKNLL